MIRYNITFDGGALMDMQRAVNRTVAPLLNQTVRAVAQQAASDWQEGVYRAKMWSGEKDDYAKSITWEMTGDFSANIRCDYKYVEDIENGRPPRDLKKMLLTSKRVRYVKNGKHAGQRFLIIPMRHNAPGGNAMAPAMPKAVYEQAKLLTPSRITGSQLQHNGGTGARVRMVKRATYNWGEQLVGNTLNAIKNKDINLKRYVGMSRFNTSTAGANSSSYLTFRVMGEWSTGWIIKAQPGQHIAKKVAAAMQPKADAAFEAAIARTMQTG